MVAAALLGACGATPNGVVRLELAITGDRTAAAERVRERLAVVDDRDDISLGDVDLSEAPPDRLIVGVQVNGGPACARFDVAKAAVLEALTKPRQLSLREVLPLDDAFVDAVAHELGDAASVRRDSRSVYLTVDAPDTLDVVGRLAGLAVGAAAAGVYVDARPQGGPQYQVWPLAQRPELRDGDLVDARADHDDHGQPFVWAQFSGAGAQRFEALTARLTGRHLAILVDDLVMSVPLVMEPIAGGRVQITMGGAPNPTEAFGEAQLMAAALRGGPIAGRVEVVSESASCAPQR
ncbi:MAG: hypothetical protein CVU56_03070 [Deltaproteobacteria bacterium HGW-Deltaproteobacteria-14]|nr:MAG: hypothetical protein CVU56_03070 [Deltaproteobacteria bacterium HGW-Deltaproteobacteria-14]